MAYLRRRNLVVGLLKEIPGFKVNMPQGAFYAFPDISYYFGKTDGKTAINDSDDFCMWLQFFDSSFANVTMYQFNSLPIARLLH